MLRKSRLAAGVAAAGACVLLAACSPVKMGAAAIVGSDRITSASLDSEVSNLQQAVTKYGVQSQIPAVDMPIAVLTWLVRFRIQDQAARDAGISVTPEAIQSALKQLDSQERQSAASSSAVYPGLAAILAASGIPTDQETELGKWLAEQSQLASKATSASQFNTAVCKAAKSLSIQVNPQFGKLQYAVDSTTGEGLYSVGAPSLDTLSRTGGGASPAATSLAQPPC